MDTGGLAHMAYNGYNANNNGNNGFGSATAGYSSRGKGAHMKRLSIAPSPGMNSINEDEEANPAPRTARSQLLAGLRTAPRQGNGVPASAPYNQQNFNIDTQNYGPRNLNRLSTNMPQSATATSFNRIPSPTNYGNNAYPNMYSFPHQMQATPGVNDNEMDPEVYNHLMQQNYFLLQKQQQLQAQLMNVTAAAQQFQGMNINGGYNSPQTPVTPSMFNQQAQNGMQPIVQPTAQPGVYSVYNPMTGQHSYVYDNQLSSPVSSHTNTSGLDMPQAGNYDSNQRFSRKDTTSPPFGQAVNKARTISPPKGTPSPLQDVTPLPPPSANAFRPGHRRSMSNAMSAAKSVDMSGPKTAGPTSTFPRTPMTGTFGLGMARAGDHPVRQPRGPPPLDELLAAPTSLHEGSKNFASRQRRRAVHDLLKAGAERHASRTSSSDMGTPSSETEIQLFVSDADSEGSSSATGSASLSGDPTFSNASTAAAIGSEWKELKERASSRDPATRPFSMSNIGGFDGAADSLGGRDFASALRGTGQTSPALTEKRRSPLLVLTSAAEKRKSSFM